jgi:hypothetical protein
VTRRRGRAALVVALARLVSARTLHRDVPAQVDADGSGAVEVQATLDAAALQRAGGDLAAVLDLDRLRSDGWSVDGPTATPDGGATVTLRQAFRDPDEARDVLADLAGTGAGSPFEGLRIDVDRGTFRDRWRFRGAVDLDRGTPVPGTPDDLAALDQQVGGSLDRLLTLRIGVRLPGDVRSNATTKAENGAVWQVRFGDGRLDLDATGTRTHPAPYVALGLGALLVILAIVWLLIRLANRVTAADRPARP